MSKEQERGIVIRRRKIWSISYAGDIVLLANNETGMRGLLKKLGKYLEKKGLQLNVDKTKIMIFRKGGRRKKCKEFKWENDKIEEVKQFVYLRFKSQENNANEKYIKHITSKAEAAMGKIWSIGEI